MILSQPKFKQFNYLLTFIKDIEFGATNLLNLEAHSETNKEK